jgi:hypothetical protein
VKRSRMISRTRIDGSFDHLVSNSKVDRTQLMSAMLTLKFGA